MRDGKLAIFFLNVIQTGRQQRLPKHNFSMIEIFRTNVQNKTQARRVVCSLKELFTEAKINFDLKDCDRILRVEGITESCLESVINGLNRLGFNCEILD
jgi:hypothetical protein